MIVAESRRGRRIVGRLDRGQDLLAALEAVCKERGVRTAELRALGSLETAELAEYDQAAKVWKPGRKFGGGGFEILNLTGNVSEKDGALALHAHVTLMRDRDNGVEIVGGHLVTARVFALEFVIETFDDVILRRAADPVTGLTLWREALEIPAAATPAAAATAVTQSPTTSPTPSTTTSTSTRARTPERDSDEALPPRLEAAVPRVSSTSKSATSASWESVAAASAATAASIAKADGEEADDSLVPGDVIVHPTFGRCDVQRIEGSYEFAHVRLRNGRLVRLSLDVLKLSAASREDGRRVFRARVE